MCYTKPGPRCSNHATKALVKAQAAYAADSSDRNAEALAQAHFDYNLTPKGVKELRDEGIKQITNGNTNDGIAAVRQADAYDTERTRLIGLVGGQKVDHDVQLSPADTLALSALSRGSIMNYYGEYFSEDFDDVVESPMELAESHWVESSRQDKDFCIVTQDENNPEIYNVEIYGDDNGSGVQTLWDNHSFNAKGISKVVQQKIQESADTAPEDRSAEGYIPAPVEFDADANTPHSYGYRQWGEGEYDRSVVVPIEGRDGEFKLTGYEYVWTPDGRSVAYLKKKGEHTFSTSDINQSSTNTEGVWGDSIRATKAKMDTLKETESSWTDASMYEALKQSFPNDPSRWGVKPTD